MTTHEILLAAQAAKLPLALADTDTKNAALEAMAVALVENSDAILAANKQDLAAALRAHQRCNAGPSCPDACPAGRHGQGHA